MTPYDAFKKVRPAIGRDGMQKMIRIEASANRITFTASTGQFSISASAERAELGTPFSCCVDGKLFGAAFEQIQTAPLTLDSKKQRLVVADRGGKISLTTTPAADFPELAHDESITLAAEIAPHLKRIVHAASVQDVRYYLMGVHLQSLPGELRASATNGHQLATVRIADECCACHRETGDAAEFAIIVPLPAVNALIDISPTEISVGLNSAGTAGTLFAERGDVQFITTLIDGKFPDIDRAIPTYQGFFRTPRQAFIDALKSTKPFVAHYPIVTMTIEPGALTLRNTNPDTSAEFTLVCTTHDGAEKTEIGMNLTYLLNTLEHVEGEEAIIQFRDGNSSIRTDDATLTGVVMPCKV